MNIEIANASANNLKNISLSIPHNSITGLTGVSGSGKSTLLKNILAAYGALNFSRLKAKTIQQNLVFEDIVRVDEIKKLPQTLFIDIINHVSNSSSTLSTISGIHGLLRELFTHAGKTYCLHCNKTIPETLFQNFSNEVEWLSIDVTYDKKYEEKRILAASIGKILKEEFYNKTGLPAKTARSRAYATIFIDPIPLCESRFKELTRLFDGLILAKLSKFEILLNPLLETFCSTCGHIAPRLSKSRFSFNVKYDEGGGQCTECGGMGKIFCISPDSLIADKEQTIFHGALHFVTATGIKYTTITEKFIMAFCSHYGIDINTPVASLPKDKLRLLLTGSEEKISFHDRVGGKKSLAFDGICNYLAESFLKKNRPITLVPFISEITCPHCENTRLDPSIDTFQLHGVVLRDILKMNLQELRDWGQKCMAMAESNDLFNILQKLEDKLSLYEKVSCSHLRLNRSSSTLSGGELQRIRLCSMLSTNIKNICYLLDEPSSGLHFHDIDNLSVLFQEIRDRGNTLIIVEHNKKLLSSCDYIIELGYGGGSEGGQVLFADYAYNLVGHQTPTAKYLHGKKALKPMLPQKDFTDAMNFSDINFNNLKNVNVTVPYNAFTTICGVSGSGKSSLVNAIFNRIQEDTVLFGFHDVFYLKQQGIQATFSTSVGGLLKLTEKVAKLYESHTGINKNNFLPSTKVGMCQSCKGKGFLRGNTGELQDVCPQCEGQCYDTVVLSHLYQGLSIHDVLNTPLSQLSQIVSDDNISKTCIICTDLGIGYLTLARRAKSLSKGEYQRLVLARFLAQNKKQTLCLLDEPSKGLHNDDILKMLEVIRRFALNKNTIIAVEHDPTVIYNSDYAIELGPETGEKGGEVVFSGSPTHMSSTATAQAILDGHSQQLYPPQVRQVFKDAPFSIKSEAGQVTLRQHSINKVSVNNHEVLLACKKTEAAFLDAAIPNNSPLLDKASTETLDLNVPMMLLVDFAKERIRSDISLYNALNLSTPLIKGFIASNPEKSYLLSSVFNDKSETGKCLRCRGKGKLYHLPKELFLDGDKLTRESTTFLANSTNFKAAKQILKSSSGQDIGKCFSKMTLKEQNLLFYGNGALLQTKSNESIEWKGIIENAIANYKYFPAPQQGAMFTTLKEKITCKFCEGKLLEPSFANYTFCGLTYADWMTLPTRDIARLLAEGSNNYFKDDLLYKLNILHKMDIEDVRFIDPIGSFSSVTQGVIKFLSLFVNNIYGTVVVLKNVDTLSPAQKKVVHGIAKNWTDSNTIIQLCSSLD